MTSAALGVMDPALGFTAAPEIAAAVPSDRPPPMYSGVRRYPVHQDPQ